MSKNALPGFFDILPGAEPEVWRSSHLWQHVEGIARQVALLYGCEEIRTPLLEREELFIRNVGEATDIVAKEMYTFVDRGDRRLALRPEGTAPVMRAFIEHQLAQRGSQHKLFYLEPMFRYERPQAGRYRQHHQFGVEAIGIAAPAQDVEIIDLLWTFGHRLGLKDLTLNLNCLGSDTSRQAYRTALVAYLESYRSTLSADSQRRLDVNPLRILDSKEAGDQAILEDAPRLDAFLAGEERAYFDQVCQLLTAIGIPYQLNPKLVRGLDYYNHTVFEITANALGAQNSVGGGGRYDGLLKKMGGPALPAFGFGCGLERIIQTLLAQGAAPKRPQGPCLYLIPLGDEAFASCFKMLHTLRQEGLHVQMELAGRKLNKAMQHANSVQAVYTAVIGDEELAQQRIPLKDMASGQTQSIAWADLLETLKNAIYPSSGTMYV